MQISTSEVSEFTFTNTKLKLFLDFLASQNSTVMSDLKSLGSKFDDHSIQFSSARVKIAALEEKLMEEYQSNQQLTNRIQFLQDAISNLSQDGSKLEAFEKNFYKHGRLIDDLFNQNEATKRDLISKEGSISKLESIVNNQTQLLDKVSKSNSNAPSESINNKFQDINENINQRFELVKKQVSEIKSNFIDKINEFDEKVNFVSRVSRDNADKLRSINSIDANNKDPETRLQQSGIANSNAIGGSFNQNIARPQGPSNSQRIGTQNNPNLEININNNGQQGSYFNQGGSSNNANAGLTTLRSINEEDCNEGYEKLNHRIKEFKLVLDGALSAIDRSRVAEENAENQIQQLISEVKEQANVISDLNLNMINRFQSLPDHSQPLLKLELKSENNTHNINNFGESIKILTAKIGSKVDKDYFDIKTNDMIGDTHSRLNNIDSAIRGLELKIREYSRKTSVHNGESTSLKPTDIDEIIKLSKETAELALQSKVSEILEKSVHFISMQETIALLKAETPLIYNSLNNIRDSLINKSEIQAQIDQIKHRVDSAEYNLTSHDIRIENISHQITGEAKEDIVTIFSNLSKKEIKDFVELPFKTQSKIIHFNFKLISERMDEQKNQVDQIKEDVIVRMKKDLNCKT